MRALMILPLAVLGACQVTNDPQNNSSSVTLSGDAAKNGAASAFDTASEAVDSAANKVNQVSNDSGEVKSGLSNLAASAGKFGKSIDHAADNVGNAVDGQHVDVRTDKSTNSTKEDSKK